MLIDCSWLIAPLNLYYPCSNLWNARSWGHIPCFSKGWVGASLQSGGPHLWMFFRILFTLQIPSSFVVCKVCWSFRSFSDFSSTLQVVDFFSDLQLIVQNNEPYTDTLSSRMKFWEYSSSMLVSIKIYFFLRFKLPKNFYNKNWSVEMPACRHLWLLI